MRIKQNEPALFLKSMAVKVPDQRTDDTGVIFATCMSCVSRGGGGGGSARLICRFQDKL